jgi:bacterioferritin-associated ferredoxin
MIKVTSEISTTKENCIAQIDTRVIVGTENGVCKDCSNQIIKAELKCLISTFVENQPDLLFNALEEVITEGLSND